MGLKKSYEEALAALRKSKKAQRRRASGVMATVYVTEDEVNSGRAKRRLKKALGKLI